MGEFDRVLSNGLHAELRYAGTGGWQLVVDGTPQSHIDTDRPELLLYEYTQRIGHVIDRLPDGPITAVHLGAGALTLPRYIAHTRPGSRQQVIELEPALVELVREHAPLPRGASIRLRYGDARETLAKLPGGLNGSVDLVVVDIFAGARTPAHVTTVEFHSMIKRLLAPGAVVAVNVADGRGLVFAKSQLSTLATVHAHVAGIASPGMLKGRTFGNLVMIASDRPIDPGIARSLASDPMPAKLVHGDELSRFIAGAPIVTDATAIDSPSPARSIFSGL